MVVVGLTRSNHSCMFSTYINIILSDKISVVYSCVVEDLSNCDGACQVSLTW